MYDFLQWRSCSLSRPRFSGFLHLRTSPETKFRGRSSDAVQAYVREGAEHGKRRGLLSPGNLTERSLSDPSRCAGGVLKALLAQLLKIARPRSGARGARIFLMKTCATGSWINSVPFSIPSERPTACMPQGSCLPSSGMVLLFEKLSRSAGVFRHLGCFGNRRCSHV